MTFKALLEEKNISIYRLSKMTGISYTCLNELANEKRSIKEVSSGHLRKMADALDMRMDMLYDELVGFDIIAFENFKSNVCHRLKEKGAVDFLMEVISDKEIEKCWEKNSRIGALYMVGLCDYLCRINGLPVNNEYEMLRSYKLHETLYPMSMSVHFKNEGVEPSVPKDAIPELLEFNIVEGDVFNVC